MIERDIYKALENCRSSKHNLEYGASCIELSSALYGKFTEDELDIPQLRRFVMETDTNELMMVLMFIVGLQGRILAEISGFESHSINKHKHSGSYLKNLIRALLGESD